MHNWMVKESTVNDYLTACRDADINNFKRDDRLTRIWEHCPYRIAMSYYRYVAGAIPEFLDKKYTNDYKGNPIISDFGGHSFSASTMQYIGVMVKIVMKVRQNLSNISICEIGGGYGGQCMTIFDVFKPKSYTIIDLPEVTELQKRYLTGIDGVECVSEIPKKRKYDLVISNYALSEIPDNKAYIDKVCMKSQSGYITCNTDFVKLPKSLGSKKHPDIEGERESNYILTW